ncbi:hypothetical protein CBR_g51429 [Chara braunii]|uniref:Uncharacterized protein n=1 Tax=Chara braunii TaxID=69332 RepID=A0A388K699_CHABU|nr:hypothetical protein CBR_g51429 [Chara braunii]|eukprot:GBG65546.1 hypothetical protein CBR_g51429 [Chara braunii]
MWNGGMCDCCLPGGDGKDGCCLCMQTLLCPCVTFGQNVQRAGAGSCVLHGLLYFIITTVLCLGLLFLAYLFLYLWLGGLVILLLALGLYGGCCRAQIRNKYNLPGGPCGDCCQHACCCFCSHCQEYRTLTNFTHGEGTGHRGNQALPMVAPPVTRLYLKSSSI